MGIRSNLTALAEVARSRRPFRTIDRVGRWARVTGGRLSVENDGFIELGERVRFMCEFGVSDIRVGPRALLRIGPRTAINYGTDIRAGVSVTIGDSVSIGPRCIIADTPFDVRDERARDASPIVIENDVWLASRVTVLPGSHIGAGAVITAGSVVSGTIPPRVLAGGTPIRVLRSLDSTDDPVADPPLAQVTHESTVDSVHAVQSRAEPEYALGGLLISDFTVDPLARILDRADGPIRLATEVAPFGAVVPTLLDPATERTDFAVVWTRPQGVLPSFLKVLDGAVDVDATTEIRSDVDRFAELLRRASNSVRTVFVMTWTLPPWIRGRGVTDLRAGGLRWALTMANARLVEALQDDSNIVVLDAQRWIGMIGPRR